MERRAPGRARRRRRHQRAGVGRSQPGRSSCCSTAARRTRTPGTPWRWRSTARWWPSTCPATATRPGATTTSTGRPTTPPPSPRPSTRSRPTPPRSSACRSAASPRSALAAHAPDLVRRLVLVDVTPGVNDEKAPTIAHVRRRARVLRRASTRSSSARCSSTPPARESSLRRGILHNAHRAARRQVALALRPLPRRAHRASAEFDMGSLWSTLEGTTAPLLLLRGSLSPVVDDADVAELQRLAARRARWSSSTAPATDPGRPTGRAGHAPGHLREQLTNDPARPGQAPEAGTYPRGP